MKRVQQRFLATLLMVVMVLLLCPAAPVTVKADGAVWDTSIAEGFASGTGTKDDPFIIETAAQLAYLAQSTNSGTSYEGQYIKLVSDIALNDDTFTFDPDTGLIKVTDGNYVVYIGSGFKGDSSGPNTDFDTTARPWAYYMTQDPSEKGYNISGDPTKWNYWQPIGKQGSEFKGNFDGGGHSISGLFTQYAMTYNGLFGYAKKARIENVTLTNSLVIADRYSGGIVGGMYSGVVENCTNAAIIIANQGMIGGIAGVLTDDGAAIRNCRNMGPVMQHNNQMGHIGGIVGNLTADAGYGGSPENVTLENCYNSGLVYGSHFGTGGIVGAAIYVAVVNCFNTGAITGKDRVGGIVGTLSYHKEMIMVENCYNIGPVNGSTYVKSVVGYFYSRYTTVAEDKLIANCVYPSDLGLGGVGTTLTRSQMLQQASYTGFDFDAVWEIGKAGGYKYPTLKGVEFVCTIHQFDGPGDKECNVCGHTRSVEHSFGAQWVTDSNSHWQECRYCKEKKNEARHEYDNACDSICNVCDYNRNVGHKFSESWDKDSSNHWHTCENCGEVADQEAHKPGAAATETTSQLCTVCQHVMTPALGHKHDYQTQWSSDGHTHWHECKGCGEKKDLADHIYDGVCDSQCDACGYTRTAPHDYKAVWSKDAENHWHECTLCQEKTDIAAHVPGPEATSVAPQTCTECGHMLAPVVGHTHTFADVWESDRSGHWRSCPCGWKTDEGVHTWKSGETANTYVCTVCSATRTEEPTATEDPNASTEPMEVSDGSDSAPENDNGLILWIIIGIVILVGIVVVVIVLSRRKEKK